MSFNSFRLLSASGVALLLAFALTSAVGHCEAAEASEAQTERPVTEGDESLSAEAQTERQSRQRPFEVAIRKLPVGVYYETLCPDSQYFLCHQLYPAMINNGWLHSTDLKFIPYGKVSSWKPPGANEVRLFCQHGHEECELNALHACLVEHNTSEEQLKLISCMMCDYKQINDCSRILGIDISNALNCKATRKTSEILEKYGLETNALRLSFVPTITVENQFHRGIQRQLLFQFERVYCGAYTRKFNVTLEHC